MPELYQKRYGWFLELGQVDYERTLNWQREMVKRRESGMIRDTIILVEHPSVVTVGRDGHKNNFLGLSREPIFIERGGDVTYHGPGQLVVYFVFNLTRRGRDLHQFVESIQEGIIRTLKEYGVDNAAHNPKSTGVWIADRKLASIGVAVKKWISFHGAAINVNTDLSDFKQINPCGLEPEVMTSLEQLIDRRVPLAEFGRILIEKYAEVFDTNFMPVHLEELAEDVKSQDGGGLV